MQTLFFIKMCTCVCVYTRPVECLCASLYLMPCIFFIIFGTFHPSTLKKIKKVKQWGGRWTGGQEKKKCTCFIIICVAG